MPINKTATLILFALLISLARADEIPDVAQLKTWLQIHEEFTIEHIDPITLISGELADKRTRQHAINQEAHQTKTSQQTYLYKTMSVDCIKDQNMSIF